MPARAHLRLYLAVDLAILTVRENQLHVLVVERANDPYQGCAALPGGLLRHAEDLRQAPATSTARSSTPRGSSSPRAPSAYRTPAVPPPSTGAARPALSARRCCAASRPLPRPSSRAAGLATARTERKRSGRNRGQAWPRG